MSDDSTTTIRATFKTREAADLAIEHLVQQHGVSRPDIFVQPVASENSAGSAPSGGDVGSNGDARTDAPLESEIEVSADIAADKIAAVQRSFGDLDAIRVSGR
ncbi:MULTISPECIES: hypothetical protein [unclassified Rhizobium]|uniref:hypothetical protein n=1 Tax=unclassified Rhizobium TaxID=2613769 RepID=UPI0007133D70|nr:MULTISPECIES: hypothetical protein [unclassified Rhizobium]KQT04883.1 hypothetical protein ASG50_16280 [Rhizobium sp. Leaf386]KQU02209.1 hypothetical protein ASG68_28460 [Rhizobium sp. Leaf453]